MKTKRKSKNAGRRMLGINLLPKTRAAIDAVARAAHRSTSGHVAALIDAELARAEAAGKDGAA
jgi:hypothetical protein